MPAISALDANSNKQNFSVAVDDNAQPMARITIDDTLPTYRAAASFTPYGTADRTLISIQGSATKTVRVKRILLMGTGTAAGSTLFTLSRTSALGTGGTAVAPSIAKMDISKPTATAVVKHYTTAAQSLGATPTVLSELTFGVSIVTLPTTGLVAFTSIFPENGHGGGAIVLRGASDFLEIGNVAGNCTAGSILQYVIEWVEDAS